MYYKINFRTGNFDPAPDKQANQWEHHHKWKNLNTKTIINFNFKKECPSTPPTDSSQKNEEIDASSESDSFIPGRPNPYAKTSGSDNTVLIAAVSSALGVVVVAVVVVMVVRKEKVRQEAKKRETVDINPMYGDNYYDYQDRNYDDGEVEYYEGNED